MIVIRDRPGERREVQHAHGGSGSTFVYGFFGEDLDPSIRFADFVIKPAACLGYHQHKDTEEIVYVVSGQMEVFQNGSRCILEPGDAVLMKPGQPHAYRNIGTEDLRILGFFAAPRGKIDVENLPLPEEISDWV